VIGIAHLHILALHIYAMALHIYVYRECAGGRYISLHSGGILGLAPPALLEEYMADLRWTSLETRRLVPYTDGLYLYIWTKSSKEEKGQQAKAVKSAKRSAKRSR